MIAQIEFDYVWSIEDSWFPQMSQQERERERERAQIKNEVEDNMMVVEKHGKREAIREEKLVNDPIVMEMSSRDVSN